MEKQKEIIDSWLSQTGDSSWSKSEKTIATVECGLIADELSDSKRILALISSSNLRKQALFVFKSRTQRSEDLSLEYILPLDKTFKCNLNSSLKTSSDNINVNISSAERKLFVEMKPGLPAQNFISELYKAGEIGIEAKAPDDFSWTKKYESKDKTDFKSGNSVVISAPVGRIGTVPIDVSERETAVVFQMALKEKEYTEIKNFSVFIGTWNVNDQIPETNETLEDWLIRDMKEAPDMYAVGFQELDLSKEAFVFNESPKEEIWQKAVGSSLHPDGDYVRVKSIRLVGILLIVYIKKKLKDFVKNIKADSVGTGIMGKLGNKGGVAVRFKFHNTSLCFVNSHLAAMTNQTERRNQDFMDINSRLLFDNKSITEHDVVYWLGDLNYRINDSDIDCKSVKEILKSGELSSLLFKDQLIQQRELNQVFKGYSEGPILFPPTYKYDLGTDDWDSSEKSRTPSWTDRILWKGSQVKQKEYYSVMNLRISDHKPVFSLFESGIKVVDASKYRKVYEEVMKKMDKTENECLPQVIVDTTELDFGKVKFCESSSRRLIVSNTGQVPVQFEFIKKLNEESYSKPWCTVIPSKGHILTGDHLEVRVEILVNKFTAIDLNSGKDQIKDILVLHLINGKDIFVSIFGEYIKSCFGASINSLVNLTVPVSETSLNGNGEEPYPVPKELWFLCDLIVTLGLDTEGLFIQPGIQHEIFILRDWLDTGYPAHDPTVSIYSVAETLLLFLESLKDPIVPHPFSELCLEACSNFQQCKQIVSQLPKYHKSVFYYLIGFLREVLSHSTVNGTDPKVFARLFGTIFLRDSNDTLKSRSNENKKITFLYPFLTSDLAENTYSTTT